ncbi:c-type cytochrome [Synechocystis sp. PCC 7509]|uniref:c-type cytochrome n=1 Tax=Synechocystis sp. PCC 7509 TaxID=927677 RepID=UPI0002AC937F|nr:c-type cytochrome [Synechocystis sp. PCC 7509]
MPFLRLALVQLALGIFAALLLGNLALAVQTNRGGEIFGQHCAACHLGGGNIVIEDKNSHISALAKYKMDSTRAIASQVKHGKKAMPAFIGRLSDFQIEEIAIYVLEQAKKGW